MKSYIGYEPDYECSPKLGTFITKELAIEFVRTFYPNYRISDIDKDYITSQVVAKDEKLTFEDIENDFSCDCYIKEEEILEELPIKYSRLRISFDDFNDSWSEYFEIMDNKEEEVKDKLFFEKSILMFKGFDVDKEILKYKNEIITEDMLNYKKIIELENGDIFLFSSLFNENLKTIYIKGNSGDLTPNYGKDCDCDYINEKGDCYKIKEERIEPLKIENKIKDNV